MPRFGVVTTATLGFVLAVALGGPGAVSAGSGQKTPRENGPSLSTTFRERLASRTKAAAAKKAGAARLQAPAPSDPKRRAAQFRDRTRTAEPSAKSAAAAKGAPWIDAASHRPSLPKAGTGKVGGTTFVGRNGTGLGDINEVEPNDETAQILDDLPVNVVGYISTDNDIDYYAITATQGETIRIEVVADRIFDTLLDSYVVVLREDGETQIASNDDFFDNSRDSFVRFTAPDSGTRVYYIGVTDYAGAGGSNFGYILNVVVADPPDIGEVEPNDTTPNADDFPIPGVAFGLSDVNRDTDVYVFNGHGGEALIVDVDAEVFLSDMDPVAELYDNRGGFLFGVDDTDGLDPRFNIILPYTGTYYLAVYDRNDLGGDSYYYSVNLSTQSGALAPLVRSFTIVNGQFLKKVVGAGFDPTHGGAVVEINGDSVRSFNNPKKPTTVMKVSPTRSVQNNDVITVVNPDGRRSNPGLVQ